MGMKAKELAKILKVSPATISLVLNNKPGISDSLRHSLIEKIKELGYEDMLYSSTASAGKNMTQNTGNRPSIAYLIYTASEENSERFAFYPAVLEGAEMEARDNNYTLLVLHVSCEGNAYLPSLLENAGAVGAIIQAKNANDCIMRDIKNLNIPCVFIDVYKPGVRISSVCVNNEQGIYSAVSYLKELGHTDIGYISSGQESDSSVERRKNFHQALREFKLPDKKDNYYSAGGQNADAYENLSAVWKDKKELPTAFMVENDLLAWRAIKALGRCGFKVPDDVSIIGFDDRSICTMTEPNLTTVKNFRNLMGREAVIMIQNKIRMKSIGVGDMPIKYELPTELIIRDSVKSLL